MIISLKSENENFSYVIGKNPDGLPKGASIRQGMAVGYFNGIQQYIVAFFDTPDVVSFPDFEGQFDYGNMGRYNSARAVLNILTTFFNQTINKENELDITTQQSLEILSIQVKRTHFLNVFMKFYPQYNIQVTPNDKWGENVNLKLSAKVTLNEFLSFVSVLCLGIAFDSNEYIDQTSDLITKYVGLLAKVDTPYLIRYYFKTRLLYHKGSFDKVSALINQSELYDLGIVHGDTHENRIRFVKENLNNTKTIVDIGCGEGIYGKRFAKSVDNYICVDKDEEVLEVAKRKLRDYDNVLFLTDWQDVRVDSDCVVILSEVIEHLAIDQVKSFIVEILNVLNPSRLIVTTPNADFNINYDLVDSMRHPDHKWEMNKDQFTDFILNLKVDNYAFTLYDIGDSVNGVYVSQGVVFERNL